MHVDIPKPISSAIRLPRIASALLVAFRLRDADTSLLKKLSDEEWESLLSFCDSAQLTLALAQRQDTGAPTWVGERLKKNITDNALRFERVKETYAEVKHTFARAQINHVVMKGFTQIPDYVSETTFRMQSDIDLYCPPEVIEPARIALEAIGYKSSKGIDYSQSDHAPTMIRLGNWKWRGNMFDPEMPLSIELHFTLWNEAAHLFPVPEVNEFWDRRVMRSVAGMSFQCFNKVDHVGYFALHILRNLLPGQWVLHHVRELAVFLHTHASDDAFWEEWVKVHSPALRAHEAIAFYYARAWFECDLHAFADREISRLPPMLRQWLNQFVGSSLLGMFDQNKDWVWLHWSLIKAPRARLALLRRVFIPSHISTLNAIGVQFENRQPRTTKGTHPYLRYFTYVISRCRAYSYVSFKTLIHGVLWKVAYHQSSSSVSR